MDYFRKNILDLRQLECGKTKKLRKTERKTKKRKKERKKTTRSKYIIFLFRHMKSLLGISIYIIYIVIYFCLFFLVTVRLYNLTPMGPIGHFYMKISDRFLLTPTTTETVKMSPGCTFISLGSDLN